MQIKDLSSLPFEEVVECFLKAFENYFVPLPQDINYWKNRFEAVKVDWKLSFGMFDNEKLVGYIINAVGLHDGKITAYNTGTGVLPAYRGHKIVDRLYQYAFPIFQQEGIEKCLLEVICENQRAIKVYERIGFETLRELRSFSGRISKNADAAAVEKVDYQKVLELGLYNSQHYSWEGSAETVKNSRDAVSSYLLKNDQGEIPGYFCIDKNSTVLQLEYKENQVATLVAGIAEVSESVKIKNLAAERKNLVAALTTAGLENTVNQYEMQLIL